MLIKNILHKNISKEKHILYSHTENLEFVRFLNKAVDENTYVHPLDNGVFAHHTFDLVICNDRLNSLDRCIHLCLYFHCPLLVVDHYIKPSTTRPDEIMFPNTTYVMVATNKSIAQSWGGDHYHGVMGTDITKPEDIKIWRDAIYKTINQPFKEIEKNDEQKQYSYTT